MIKECVSVAGLYWYVGPSYRQAKQIAWVRLKTLLSPASGHWKFNEQELYAENVYTKSRIELKGADNEDSLLGVGLKGVVLDEAAMIRESVWPKIIRPTLADSQGWAMFISTPRGMNWFYDLYIKGLVENEEWQSWHHPTHINKYIPKTEIEQMKLDMSERLYRQEILAEFLDDDCGVFKKINRCIVGEMKSPVTGRFYVMGVDLAKTVDFTVLTVMDSVTRELVAFERFQDVSWTEQKIRIQSLAKKYNNALCFIDSTGVGDPVVEDLQKSGVSVDGIKFTSASKFNLIDNLSIAIEQRLITFPMVEVLIKELKQFEYVITNAGNIKYSAPEGKHDDCVISLALAVWGIRHGLKEAQVISDQLEVQWVNDQQGMGELVEEETEINAYSGY